MLLLTNDGAWADRVLHPRHGVEREYAIGLERPLDDDQVEALEPGSGWTRAARRWAGLRAMTQIEVERLGDLLRPATARAWSGTGRPSRRAGNGSCVGCSAPIGAPVARLVRVRIGPVRIDGLRSGAIRPLKAPEMRGLGAGGGRSRSAPPRSDQAEE